MNYSIWKKTLKAIGIMALSVSAIACTSDDDKPVKTNELTIADVLKAEDGVTFTNLECVTVVAANTQGVLLQENGSSIYAFIGEKHNFSIGDMVTVESHGHVQQMPPVHQRGEAREDLARQIQTAETGTVHGKGH